MKYQTETFDNTPTGRFLVVEEMYNLLHRMTSLWDALKELETDLKAIYDTLQNMPVWTMMKMARKRGPEDDALDA